MDYDLDVARDIQKLLLPKHWPRVPGLLIEGKSNAAQQVGGDYLDTIQIDEHTIAFAIADVSGKGVPGALMMSIFRTQVRSRAKFHKSPVSLLQEINEDMASEIKKGMFISAIYGMVDLRDFSLCFARAGHNPPVLYQKENQSLSEITPGGMALGIGDNEMFGFCLEEAKITLEPGDSIVFYTDGVTEAQNAEGKEFGLNTFMNAIRKSAHLGARGILEHVAHHLTRFAVGVPQQDDITLLVLCRPDSGHSSAPPRNSPEENGFPESI
jgi:sigma-B regulation protein RsbU (phosphoserine phosphatase)